MVKHSFQFLGKVCLCGLMWPDVGNLTSTYEALHMPCIPRISNEKTWSNTLTYFKTHAFFGWGTGPAPPAFQEQMAKLIEEVTSLRVRVATMEATGQVVSPSGSGPQGFWKSSTGWWWWQNYVATCFCRHHEQGGATYGELVLAFLKNAWSTYNKCVIIAWLMQA